MLPALKQQHAQRSASNPDFRYIQETIARIDKKKDKKVVSLNLAKRQKEYQQSRQEQLDIENRRRLAKGEEPYKSIKELDEKEDVLGLHEDDDEEEEKEDTDSRTLLVEAAHILADYIQLKQNELANK